MLDEWNEFHSKTVPVLKQDLWLALIPFGGLEKVVKILHFYEGGKFAHGDM